MLFVAHFFIALDPPTPTVVVSFNIIIVINPLFVVFPEEEEEKKAPPLAAARFLPSLAANDKNMMVLSLSLSLSLSLRVNRGVLLLSLFFFFLVVFFFCFCFSRRFGVKTKQQQTLERNKITATNQNFDERNLPQTAQKHSYVQLLNCMAFSPHIKSLSKKGRSRMTTNIKRCPFIEREQRCKKS
jgi:hypothetical protein